MSKLRRHETVGAMDTPVRFFRFNRKKTSLGKKRVEVDMGIRFCQMIYGALRETDEAEKHMPSAMAWLKTWREPDLLTTDLVAEISDKKFDVLGVEESDRFYVYLKIQWHGI